MISITLYKTKRVRVDLFVSVCSQDCDHVSQTAEEFYTVRCQVADMKNIYVSFFVLSTQSLHV